MFFPDKQAELSLPFWGKAEATSQFQPAKSLGLPVGRLVPKADGQDRAPDVRTGLTKGDLEIPTEVGMLLSVSMFRVYARYVTVIHFVL